MLGGQVSPLRQLLRSQHEQRRGRREAEEERIRLGWGAYVSVGELAASIEEEEPTLNIEELVGLSEIGE